MDIEKLNSANSLNREISNVTNLLDKTVDNLTINITCGDSATLTFTQVENLDDNVATLKSECRDSIIALVKSYEEQLKKRFEEL